ncbi:hypothetical protein RND71_002488 [Anisodus tanguticus]|uniref:Uncharacterized protein n=1 Tax=Anisodus tanguticus TaxID=243964 RepID=A0AAE1T2W2_9SOLA|nr:hypothetical protein RND71_002488 [Anisodus tanguticus]
MVQVRKTVQKEIEKQSGLGSESEIRKRKTGLFLIFGLKKYSSLGPNFNPKIFFFFTFPGRVKIRDESVSGRVQTGSKIRKSAVQNQKIRISKSQKSEFQNNSERIRRFETRLGSLLGDVYMKCTGSDEESRYETHHDCR